MAIEEQLRITTPIQNLYRYTRADYQVGDVTIPNGSRVLLSFGAPTATRWPSTTPTNTAPTETPARTLDSATAHICAWARH